MSEVAGGITHHELVKQAARYLKRRGKCSIITTELRTAAYSVPAAVGWRCGIHSTVIEGKVSRSDFHRDKKKFHRREQYQCGTFRYYLTPTGLLSQGDLPVGWGLLEFDGLDVTQCIEAPRHVNPNRSDELRILCSLLRRSQAKGPSDLMSDLKLIDELLCYVMQVTKMRPDDLEGPKGDTLTREVMKRLRHAYQSGEMPVITLSLANHFARTVEPY